LAETSTTTEGAQQTFFDTAVNTTRQTTRDTLADTFYNTAVSTTRQTSAPTTIQTFYDTTYTTFYNTQIGNSTVQTSRITSRLTEDS
jgi:hypothetical protein